MRSSRRLVVIGILAVLASVLSVPAAGGATGRQVLYDHSSTYPRLIRLEHSMLANGRMLSSVNGWTREGDGIGVISESLDGGESFHRISTIHDPAAKHGQGICCSTLYELPTAVGDMPEGTLLWSDTVGFRAPHDGTPTRQRVWRSSDDGRSWEFLSEFGVSPNQYPTWEPEFSVAKDGSLVAFYSDETEKSRFDQKLVQVRSTDGEHWSAPRNTVADPASQSTRPGMPSVRQLSDGSYLLAYEVCNKDLTHQCAAYYRRSADGWDYGDPAKLGSVVRTTEGRYVLHTPTLAVAPDGNVLMIGEMLVNADGSRAGGNGRTMLANDPGVEGPWQELPAPVAVNDPNDGHCKNFSPTILPSTDGSEVTEITTDLDGKACKTYHATAPLEQ